ncbi:hypothetical protein [Erythrobacter sp. HL-111]|uniref:hypothetical protein n=1 Tax=Erythrobacter sp. HL-111 TaxID=1798193 RepID=UPI0006DA9179|nr:hypothetical protein [Erythrobacter sp. HL-111]KPP95001.1 MAG: hypothetical protein HLUCCO15_02855 [Erythrobacteraceae bacterium HL-111]
MQLDRPALIEVCRSKEELQRVRAEDPLPLFRERATGEARLEASDLDPLDAERAKALPAWPSIFAGRRKAALRSKNVFAP